MRLNGSLGTLPPDEKFQLSNGLFQTAHTTLAHDGYVTRLYR